MRFLLKGLSALSIAVVVILSASCSSGDWIVKIDGEAVSVQELDQLYYAHHKQVLQQMKFDVTNADVDRFASDPSTVQRLPTLNKEIFLSEIINQRLIYNKAVEAGVLKNPDLKAMMKIAEDTAVVQYYIREKFKNEISVSDQEVESFYNENRANFKLEPIDQAEKKIRQFLSTQRLMKQMKKFVDDLKDIARIEKSPTIEKQLHQSGAVNPQQPAADNGTAPAK